MTRSMISFLIAVSVMFFATPLLSEDGYEVQYTAEFSPDQLSFDKLMGYDIVRLQEADLLTELAKPMLPTKEIKIALPQGMAIKNVRVVRTEREEIAGEYDIFPAQPPIRIGQSDKNVDSVEPDQRTYTSNVPYPSKLAEFVHQTDLAGQSIVILQLYPLQYVPGEKKLTFYTSITFVLEGEGGYECAHYLPPNISEMGRRCYEQMIKGMVKNPEDVELKTGFRMSLSTVLPDGPFDHVIITSSSYASYFQPLVDWHNQRGIRDTIVTTSWIYSNYAGADTQKIRNFVIDANSIWGTIYFLFGGETATAPFVYRNYYDESTPSDQYYSDFNDNWTHEVFVGRITAENSTQINTFIEKALKYEKDPPRTNYPLEALLIGMDLDPQTHAEWLKASIESPYIPSRFSVSKVYDSHGGNHRDSVVHYLNAGQHLVNHADHSWIDYMGTGDRNHGWGIYSSDVDNLGNNDQMSVIVSLGCDPNRMDANDCIAEHFVIYNSYQAGVAFTGNTRSGWGYVGNPYALSGKLDWEWWKGLFSRNKYILGQTLVDSKHNSPNSQGIERHCEWTFNLLGEPAMPIWTDEPDSFVVSCPSTLPPRPSSFPVYVEDATTNTPVNQAYVCLWKENDVYLTGYTDAGGVVTFNPWPSATGMMYVTVTKHDYIPHQQQVDVSGYILGDVNADGVINSADIVYLINYIYKEGTPPDPLESADVNCDEVVNSADVVFLVNHLFKEGPPPAC